MPEFQEHHESRLMREPIQPSDLTPKERQALGYAANIGFGFSPLEPVQTVIESPRPVTMTVQEKERPAIRWRQAPMKLDDFLAQRAQQPNQPDSMTFDQ